MAVLIVDMQNAFCSRNGSFSKRGFKLLNLDKTIRTIQKIIKLAEKNKWPIIFTRLEFTKNYSDAGLLVKNAPEIKRLKAYQKNSFDSQIIGQLKYPDNAIIIAKTRYDPFQGTGLEKKLRQNKIGQIIVAGVLTNVCVESTVRSAFDKDFEILIVEDGTTTYSKKLQKASLTTLGKHFAKVVSLKNLNKKAQT
mgnify:CR=1 FL=1